MTIRNAPSAGELAPVAAAISPGDWPGPALDDFPHLAKSAVAG